MEKQNKTLMHEVPEGDLDGHIDWEDFIVQ